MQLFKPGGDKGVRTPDLLNANQTLSQLSYAPNFRRTSGMDHITPGKRCQGQDQQPWVGQPRLERGTSVLSGLRSNQLSYRPQAKSDGQLKSE